MDGDLTPDGWRLAYICAVCGGIAHTEEDSLDTGTTLTHAQCGGKTVVTLSTPESYVADHRARALRQLTDAAAPSAADQPGQSDPRAQKVTEKSSR